MQTAAWTIAVAATISRQWYEGKSCVVCRRSLDHLDWLQHKPAALGPDRRTVEWRNVAPEKIPELLATHSPICWNCHNVETFRREHPELVVERPWTIERR
jgi:hypothetical protein